MRQNGDCFIFTWKTAAWLLRSARPRDQYYISDRFFLSGGKPQAHVNSSPSAGRIPLKSGVSIPETNQKDESHTG
jgi:hypothetical protein